MQLSVEPYDFHLPSELIARYPTAVRSESRLLRLEKPTGALSHHTFHNILSFLRPGDCLVINDTKVMPARVFGYKATGGKVELLIEKVLPDNSVKAFIKASKAPKLGSEIYLDETTYFRVEAKNDAIYQLHCCVDKPVLEILEQFGHIPLPPYMNRDADAADKERYQTVFAAHPGAVAAPTAGLHFTDTLLAEIANKGIAIERVTLHVGAGTFQPLREDALKTKRLHAEYYAVAKSVWDNIMATKKAGGRVVAVGTTSVRTLETVAINQAQFSDYVGEGETELFIYPGFNFQVIDAMITNFHLPKSSLLMLVSAFAGTDNILAAYKEAVATSYRFYSYGDAMLIEGKQ